ncbi:MAG: RNase H-like domain-containing protein [Saprospiraceae bacterium]
MKLDEVFEAGKVDTGQVIAEGNGTNHETNFTETGILEAPDPVDFESTMKDALRRAIANGCKDVNRLETILRKHKEVFAFTFDDCKISKLTPMKPELKAGANPTFAKPRRMSLEQLQWLEKHVAQMVKLGMLKEVRNPTWGVPVFVVTKPGGKGFRMVADFRAVNSRCLSNTLPMPLLEQMLSCTIGSTIFGSFDNMKGFNLLGAENSEPFTLVTPFGCYQMMVAPQGYLNSPVVYQDRIVNQVLKGIHGISCCNWIDDCLLFGLDENQYLQRLDDLLGRYALWDVKLNFAKCEFYAKKLTWCGREFSAKGYCYDAKYYDKVLDTPEPELATELHDFIFAVGWIQDSLEPFGVLEAKGLLMNFLNKCFEVKTPKGKKSSRKKKNLVGIKLREHGWGTVESDAFKKVLKTVHEAIKMAVPDPDKEFCLFTDASNTGCSIVVTQTDKEELSKPITEQSHQIVFLTTHKWTEQEVKWHISSQEAYPVVFALERLDYLFAGKRINIFMDHKNLIYIFEPEAATSKTTLMRLQRWALIIQSSNYCIRHISGEDNIVADLFSRWALDQRRCPTDVKATSSRILRNLQEYNKGGKLNNKWESTRLVKKREFYDPEVEDKKPQWSRRKKITFDNGQESFGGDKIEQTHRTVKTQVPKDIKDTAIKASEFSEHVSRIDPMKDLKGSEVQIPTREEIKLHQETTKDKIPRLATKDDVGMYRVNGRLWIPSEVAPIVVAIAHSVSAHPGINTLVEIIQRYFWMEKLRHLVKQLNKYCLICCGEHMPKAIPRKYGEQIHATKRNQVLHSDFCYVKGKYILTIRDDLTGKTELFLTDTADALAAADALLWWRARYGLCPDTIVVTDGGSHFANSLIKELVAKLRIRHHITVAYSPWANGKAENINREFLKVLRILSAKAGYDGLDNWTRLISSVQDILNNTPRKRLGNKTSHEVFLGMKKTDMVGFLMVEEDEYSVRNVPLSQKKLVEFCDELERVLDRNNREVIDVQYLLRKKHLENQVDSKDDAVQFAVGDWVLVSRATRKPDKLHFQWTGPFQIVDTENQFVYRVRSMINGKEMNVHSRRIAFYESKYLLKEDVRSHVLRSTKGFQISKIVDSRWDSTLREYFLLCKWFGMEEVHDSWMEFPKVVDLDSDMVDRYLLQADLTPTVKSLLKKRQLI